MQFRSDLFRAQDRYSFVRIGIVAMMSVVAATNFASGQPAAQPPLLPVPKAAPSPFSPNQFRLPRLGDPGPLGTTPRPTPEDIKEQNRFIEGVVDPKNTLDVVEGRSRLILLKSTPTKTQIADPTVLELNVLEPKQLTILGKKAGTTVLTLFFADPDDKDKTKVLSFLVRVIPDPEARERLEKVYAALEKEISKLFPDSYIRLSLVGDKLVVRGQAKDVAEATQILRIVRANAPGGGGGGAGEGAGGPGGGATAPINNINLSLTPNDPLNPFGTPGLSDFRTIGGPNVVNLLRIPGEQQVMLRVTVAEVNRAAARSIGLNFSIINNQGVPVVTSTVGRFTANATTGATGALGTGSGLFGTAVGGGTGTANLPVLLDNGQIVLAINALKTLSYARSLAEPTLVALNGNTATFQSGGQFPVPVLGGFGQFNASGNNNMGSGLQGVQFVPFGVQLAFTPVITDRDRVRLNVSATVSTRDLANQTNIGGSSITSLNTRNFSSVVEMRDGQSLAVAGLIQNNLGSDSSRIPFIGDIPFFGRLASNDNITAGEQELVILITPELVHPFEKNEISKLPGSDLFEPDDIEFYLHGRLESHEARNFRSPVMNDLHRLRAYRHCEENYIFGPAGHTPVQGVPGK